MSTIAIAKKIEDIKAQLNELSSEIENQKSTSDVDLSWDFVYAKAIQLNETANRVKVQVKLKTR
jgi:hypothetical protein